MVERSSFVSFSIVMVQRFVPIEELANEEVEEMLRCIEKTKYREI